MKNLVFLVIIASLLWAGNAYYDQYLEKSKHNLIWLKLDIETCLIENDIKVQEDLITDILKSKENNFQDDSLNARLAESLANSSTKLLPSQIVSILKNCLNTADNRHKKDNSIISLDLLIPVLDLFFAWSLASVIYEFLRIVKKGYQNAIQWQGASKLRKIHIVFNHAFGLFYIVIFILWLDGLRLSKKVGAIPKSDHFFDHGEFITLNGSWSGNRKPNELSNIQSSEIKCSKEEMRCYEAIASINNGILYASYSDYTITEWSESKVLIKKIESFCNNTIINIDRKTKSVSGVIEHNDESDCVPEPSSTFKLVDGWDVHKEEVIKNLSFIGRIFRAIFNL